MCGGRKRKRMEGWEEEGEEENGEKEWKIWRD
jgi:hypothetical protein